MGPAMPFYPWFSKDPSAYVYPLGFLSSVPMEMEIPCPPTPLILVTNILNGRLTGIPEEQLRDHADRARSMSNNYLGKFGHKKYFSSDMRCGSPVKLLHATGFSKQDVFWQNVFNKWGA